MSRSRAASAWDLPVRRVERHRDAAVDTSTWPGSVPAVRELLERGLDLGPATVLVGENGSGKSTVVEGIASAFGLNLEGGTRDHRHSTRASESDLGAALQLRRGASASKRGFFLRAETMHGFYTYLESVGSGAGLHDMSHGESFLTVMEGRFIGPGLYLLDEPESALSFSGCLALLRVLHDLAGSGRAQVLVATHSPVVAALPGARILEVDDSGLHERAWEDLELVSHWRSYLADPQRYLRHLLDPPEP